MSSPSLADSTAAGYSTYSMPLVSLSIPNHYDVYDANPSTSCIGVLMPSPDAGAVNYVRNGKYLLIGMYHDTGRLPYTSQSQSASWTKLSPTQVRIQASIPFLYVGKYIEFISTDLTPATKVNCRVTQVLPASFDIEVAATNNSGTLIIPAIQFVFEEEFVVFRIFPNFKLVPIAEVLALFISTAPVPYRNASYLKNITAVIHSTGAATTVQTPTNVTAHVNYQSSNIRNQLTTLEPSLPKISISQSALGIPSFEHQQVFDSNDRPLTLRYDSYGRPIKPFFFDDKNKNNPYMISTSESVGYLLVCDFYGYEINDAGRAPFFSTVVFVANLTNNTVVTSLNISNLTTPVSTIYDVFGNIIVGAISVPASGGGMTTALLVERQQIPLALDNFGRPTSTPRPRLS